MKDYHKANNAIHKAGRDLHTRIVAFNVDWLSLHSRERMKPGMNKKLNEMRMVHPKWRSYCALYAFNVTHCVPYHGKLSTKEVTDWRTVFPQI